MPRAMAPTGMAIGLLVLIVHGPASPVAAQAAAPRRPTAASPLPDLSSALEVLAEKVSPAVVQILATGYAPASSTGGVLAKQRSTGSGVILDPSGYIVTNNHVVQGARRIQVILSGPAARSPRASVLRPHGPTLGAQLVGLL